METTSLDAGVEIPSYPFWMFQMTFQTNRRYFFGGGGGMLGATDLVILRPVSRLAPPPEFRDGFEGPGLGDGDGGFRSVIELHLCLIYGEHSYRDQRHHKSDECSQLQASYDRVGRGL